MVWCVPAIQIGDIPPAIKTKPKRGGVSPFLLFCWLMVPVAN